MRSLWLPLLASAVVSGCVIPQDPDHPADVGSGSEGGKADQLPDDDVACTDPSFDIELIASGNVGEAPTFRIDGAGTQHVLFVDRDEDHMVYGRRGAGEDAWTFEPTDCTGVVDPAVWSPVPATSNQTLAVTPAGDVYVACGNKVLHRPAGGSGWDELPIKVEEDPDPTATWYLATGAMSVIVADDGTVHAVTLSARWTIQNFHLQTIAHHIELTPAGWQQDVITDWWASNPNGGVRPIMSRIALCERDALLRIGMPVAYAYGPVYVGGEPGGPGDETWKLSLLRYHGQVAQGSGYQPVCAIDGEGRAIHVGYNYGYNGSYDALEIIRKGDGDPIVKEVADGGRYPDIAIRGDTTFVSYQLEDALRLYVATPAGVDHLDVSDTASHTSIALDPAGRPYIAYYDHGDARLELAVGRCD